MRPAEVGELSSHPESEVAGAAGAAGGLRWRGAVLAVLGHPPLWPIALRQLFALARPGWARRWPPLPVPDPAYLRFRLLTAYGDPDRDPDAADLLAYLKWCRRMRALSR